MPVTSDMSEYDHTHSRATRGKAVGALGLKRWILAHTRRSIFLTCPPMSPTSLTEPTVMLRRWIHLTWAWRSHPTIMVVAVSAYREAIYTSEIARSQEKSRPFDRFSAKLRGNLQNDHIVIWLS